MSSRTQRTKPQLVAPVNNPKMLARRAVVAPLADDGSDRPTGRDENTVDRCALMTKILEEASDGMDNDRDSLTVERVASDPMVEGLVK